MAICTAVSALRTEDPTLASAGSMPPKKRFNRKDYCTVSEARTEYGFTKVELATIPKQERRAQALYGGLMESFWSREDLSKRREPSFYHLTARLSAGGADIAVDDQGESKWAAAFGAATATWELCQKKSLHWETMMTVMGEGSHCPAGDNMEMQDATYRAADSYMNASKFAGPKDDFVAHVEFHAEGAGFEMTGSNGSGVRVDRVDHADNPAAAPAEDPSVPAAAAVQASVSAGVPPSGETESAGTKRSAPPTPESTSSKRAVPVAD